MVITSISRIEVAVDEMVYIFDTPQEADEFMACLIDGDLVQCKVDHPPLDIRPAS
jgi:hypothetical protein